MLPIFKELQSHYIGAILTSEIHNSELVLLLSSFTFSFIIIFCVSGVVIIKCCLPIFNTQGVMKRKFNRSTSVHARKWLSALCLTQETVGSSYCGIIMVTKKYTSHSDNIHNQNTVKVKWFLERWRTQPMMSCCSFKPFPSPNTKTKEQHVSKDWKSQSLTLLHQWKEYTLLTMLLTTPLFFHLSVGVNSLIFSINIYIHTSITHVLCEIISHS